MNVVIIDDEPFARQIIESIILDNFPFINIVGQAGSVLAGVDIITSKKPDLVFLDVDLIDGTGFDILQSLDSIDFKVVFITAYQEYALRAIKFSAFDFILKPVKADELINAVNKVRVDSKMQNQVLKMEALINNISKQETSSHKIVLKTSESIHLVPVADIVRCEADNNYTTFFLVGNEKIVISKGLREYEELLEEHGFFRVHQSHLINLNFILRFDKRDGGFVILSDKSTIPVSQRKKQKLLEYFERLN